MRTTAGTPQLGPAAARRSNSESGLIGTESDWGLLITSVMPGWLCLPRSAAGGKIGMVSRLIQINRYRSSLHQDLETVRWRTILYTWPS